MCFRKCATFAPVEGPAYWLDVARYCESVNIPSELCSRRSGMFAEVARLVPPDLC